MLYDVNPLSGRVSAASPAAALPPSTAFDSSRPCASTWATYDGACRAVQHPEASVAYNGFGTYRRGCAKISAWNAWLCNETSTSLRRLIIASPGLGLHLFTLDEVGATDSVDLVAAAQVDRGGCSLLRAEEERLEQKRHDRAQYSLVVTAQ